MPKHNSLPFDATQSIHVQFTTLTISANLELEDQGRRPPRSVLQYSISASMDAGYRLTAMLSGLLSVTL
jgi:hypothetical protein